MHDLWILMPQDGLCRWIFYLQLVKHALLVMPQARLSIQRSILIKTFLNRSEPPAWPQIILVVFSKNISVFCIGWGAFGHRWKTLWVLWLVCWCLSYQLLHLLHFLLANFRLVRLAHHLSVCERLTQLLLRHLLLKLVGTPWGVPFYIFSTWVESRHRCIPRNRHQLLPSLQVLLAFVEDCGGFEVEKWLCPVFITARINEMVGLVDIVNDGGSTRCIRESAVLFFWCCLNGRYESSMRWLFH